VGELYFGDVRRTLIRVEETAKSIIMGTFYWILSVVGGADCKVCPYLD